MTRHEGLRQELEYNKPLGERLHGLEGLTLQTGGNLGTNGLRIDRGESADPVIADALLSAMDGSDFRRDHGTQDKYIYLNRDNDPYSAIERIMNSPNMQALVERRQTWRDDREQKAAAKREAANEAAAILWQERMAQERLAEANDQAAAEALKADLQA